MELLASRGKWWQLIGGYWEEPPVFVAKQKVFKPKFRIPKLDSYKDVNPGPDYWGHWPVNMNRVGKSRISGEKLRKMALQAGYTENSVTLKKCYRDLTEGATIGCEGIFRGKSKSTNAQSAFLHGEKVSDSIAEWIDEGFAYGPVDPSEIPEDCKITGIMTKEKPNGAVRVILNLSAPEGLSVNEGIDGDQFPAVMSSTKKWLVILHRAGSGCKMVKIDWSAG